MSLQDFFDKCPDSVVLCDGFTIQWSQPGIGFGSFYFQVKEDGTILIDNEAMSREFIKKILNKLVDEAKLIGE